MGATEAQRGRRFFSYHRNCPPIENPNSKTALAQSNWRANSRGQSKMRSVSSKAHGKGLLIGVASGGAVFAGLLAGCALLPTSGGDNPGDSGVTAPDGQRAGSDGPAGEIMDAASTVDVPVSDRDAGASNANNGSDANAKDATAADAADGAPEDSNPTPPDAGSGPVVDSSASQDSGNPSIDSGAPADESVWLVPMNQARAKVNEAPLVWDPIAAQVALNYAKQCNYMHNPNASAEYAALGGKSHLGENIAAGAPTETIANAISSWVNEVADYNHANNTCAKVCGHYTQIVWSTTTGVGCAQVSCTTNSPFGTFGAGRWQFEVCDYSPAGNIIGKPPY